MHDVFMLCMCAMCPVYVFHVCFHVDITCTHVHSMYVSMYVRHVLTLSVQCTQMTEAEHHAKKVRLDALIIFSCMKTASIYFGW